MAAELTVYGQQAPIAPVLDDAHSSPPADAALCISPLVRLPCRPGRCQAGRWGVLCMELVVPLVVIVQGVYCEGPQRVYSSCVAHRACDHTFCAQAMRTTLPGSTFTSCTVLKTPDIGSKAELCLSRSSLTLSCWGADRELL